MSKTARTPYRRKKRQKQKRKDVRAARTVKSNESDAAGAMSSSEQTVLSSVIDYEEALYQVYAPLPLC